MVFKKLLKHLNRNKRPERIAYGQIVAQARQKGFYASANVPDSVDGRYDMIVLHAFLLMNRLNEEKSADAKEFSQSVFNEMFVDMDHSLREMGVGDLSVGKKIKKMAQVFYGRAKAYEEAITCYENEPQLLEDVIVRNIFCQPQQAGQERKVANYVFAATKALQQQPITDLLAGNVIYPVTKDFF